MPWERTSSKGGRYNAKSDYSPVRTGSGRLGSANCGIRSWWWWWWWWWWWGWWWGWWWWGCRGGGVGCCCSGGVSGCGCCGGGVGGGVFHRGGFHRRAFVGFGLGSYGYYDGYYPYAYNDDYYDDGGCYVVRRRVHTRYGWRVRSS